MFVYKYIWATLHLHGNDNFENCEYKLLLFSRNQKSDTRKVLLFTISEVKINIAAANANYSCVHHEQHDIWIILSMYRAINSKIISSSKYYFDKSSILIHSKYIFSILHDKESKIRKTIEISKFLLRKSRNKLEGWCVIEKRKIFHCFVC